MRRLRFFLQGLSFVILVFIGYKIDRYEFGMIWSLFNRWQSIFIDWKATLIAIGWNTLFGAVVIGYFFVNRLIGKKMA